MAYYVIFRRFEGTRRIGQKRKQKKKVKVRSPVRYLDKVTGGDNRSDTNLEVILISRPKSCHIQAKATVRTVADHPEVTLSTADTGLHSRLLPGSRGTLPPSPQVATPRVPRALQAPPVVTLLPKAILPITQVTPLSSTRATSTIPKATPSIRKAILRNKTDTITIHTDLPLVLLQNQHTKPSTSPQK